MGQGNPGGQYQAEVVTNARPKFVLLMSLTGHKRLICDGRAISASAPEATKSLRHNNNATAVERDKA